jgi:hypothetical protein
MQSTEQHHSAKDQVVELFQDLEHEVEREASPAHDSSQSDMLVKKHVTGLAVSFFVLISVFLVAAIVAIAMYTHR